MPTDEIPRSMSVVPDGGRFLKMFKLGMRTEDEQSKVPLVLMRKIVGTPDLATLCAGVKPPLAQIFTT